MTTEARRSSSPRVWYMDPPPRKMPTTRVKQRARARTTRTTPPVAVVVAVLAAALAAAVLKRVEKVRGVVVGATASSVVNPSVVNPSAAHPVGREAERVERVERAGKVRRACAAVAVHAGLDTSWRKLAVRCTPTAAVATRRLPVKRRWHNRLGWRWTPNRNSTVMFQPHHHKPLKNGQIPVQRYKARLARQICFPSIVYVRTVTRNNAKRKRLVQIYICEYGIFSAHLRDFHLPASSEYP